MPKLADHQERRREAVEALWRVIAEQGFAGVSVRSVVAETSWSRGIVDYYFENFEELLRLGLPSLCEDDLAGHLQAGQLVGVEALRAMLLAGMPLDEQRQMSGRIWLAYLGHTVSDPEVRHEYARCQALRGQVWQVVLAQMVERGELSAKADLEMMATHIMAFELSMNVYALLNPHLVNAAVFEGHVDQFIAALRAGCSMPESG